MNPMPFGVCYDCDQLTGGRCWRHAVVVTVVGTMISVGDVEIIPPSLPVKEKGDQGK